ncbi:MAG: hypothetical protein J1F32_03745 [Erysipelotrichales bacterium]|nr:hypothetical protein [Erysipelotrichales bacterium]
MEKSIILIPYAEDPKKKSGVNIHDNTNRKEIYLKNCCVAAISAKKYNANSDVALVTNTEIPQDYLNILNKNSVLVIYENYDEFVFGDDYNWSLAFYKLCTLSKVLKKYNYEYYAYLDSDVYVQNSFDNIWKECDQHIMMYDISHGLQVTHYGEMIEEFNKFFGELKMITHYGGEFFAASHENAKNFIEKCSIVYHEMKNNHIITTHGDEFIISIAAYYLGGLVKNASPYIFRFWTGEFYLVSTSFQYNPITVLHVPNEKERGMLKLFHKYIKKDRLPSNKIVWKICHLQKPRTIDVIKKKIRSLIKK